MQGILIEPSLLTNNILIIMPRRLTRLTLKLKPDAIYATFTYCAKYPYVDSGSSLSLSMLQKVYAQIKQTIAIL